MTSYINLRITVYVFYVNCSKNRNINYHAYLQKLIYIHGINQLPVFL